MIEQYKKLLIQASTTHKNIVSSAKIMRRKTIGSAKLRIYFKDKSFLDVWLGKQGKYSYHWESRAQRGKIYRHDNAPDHPEIATHPKHLHCGEEQNVQPSKISSNPSAALKFFLDFIKETYQDIKRDQ